MHGTPYGGSSTNGYSYSYGDPYCYTSYVASSPDYSYTNNDGTYSCPHQFITELRGTTNNSGAIHFIAEWTGTTLTSSNCQYAHIDMGAYAYEGSVLGWQLLGTRKYTGTWVSGQQISYCTSR